MQRDYMVGGQGAYDLHCSQPAGIATFPRNPLESPPESKELADRSSNKVSMLTSSRRQSEADNCGF